jgi:nucleotide-binding universal stress UspA family protein
MAIKKILFPTDFSIDSANAFNYAINIAGALNSEIVILHSYEKPSLSTDIPITDYEEQLKNTETKIHRHLSEIIEYGYKVNPSIKLDYIISQGDFTQQIECIVKEKNIELIIMSTLGIHSLKSFLIGTNAATIIEKTLCPVLVIPQKYAFDSLKNILFTSDFLDSDLEHIEYLTSIAKPFGAKITIANISDEEGLVRRIVFKDFEKEVKNKISYPNINFNQLKGSNINECITNYVENEHIDLIVMSTRHRNAIEKFYNPSLTKKMAYHTAIPLLAFHVKDIYQIKQ